MSVMFYDSSEGEQTFETVAWTEVFTKTGNLRITSNFIQLSAEYGGSVVNIAVGIRVLIDGVERSFDYHVPTIAGQYKKFTDFGILTLTEEGNHTISVEVRALAAGQTVKVRRMRMMVMQV